MVNYTKAIFLSSLSIIGNLAACSNTKTVSIPTACADGSVSRMMVSSGQSIGFDVTVNGDMLGHFGADDLEVNSVMVDGLGKLGKNAHPQSCQDQDNYMLTLTAGGLRSDKEHRKNTFVNWLQQYPLKTGDVVSIKIVESQKFDAPANIMVRDVEPIELKCGTQKGTGP